MKKKVLMIAGIVMFALTMFANLQFAFNNYDVSTGSIDAVVWAQSGGTGGGSSNCGPLYSNQDYTRFCCANQDSRHCHASSCR